MGTKSCCCGCDLRTGTMIMIFLIGIPTVAAFYGSVTSQGSMGSVIMAEVFVLASCISAVYSIKKNDRNFLIPFIFIIIVIFIAILILSLVILLAFLGVSTAVNTLSSSDNIGSIFSNIMATQVSNSDRDNYNGWGGYGNNHRGPYEPSFNFGDNKPKSDVSVKMEIGPWTILIFMLTICNIALFLHFVRVVCALFTEMGKPNGVVFQPSPYA